ncbi:MAG: thymidylate synthase [Candidatus Caldarchaeum sp.]
MQAVFKDWESLEKWRDSLLSREGRLQFINRVAKTTIEVRGIQFEICPEYDEDRQPIDLKWAAERHNYVRAKCLFQINQVKKLLKTDSTTREAYILEMDYHPENVPCNLVHHFMIRDGKLELFVYLRSSNSKDILPLDIYSAKKVQKEIADFLGIPIGPIKFFVGSFHVYV